MSCFYFILVLVFLHFSVLTSVSCSLGSPPKRVNKTATKNLVAIIMFWALDLDSLHFYSRKTYFLDNLSFHIYNVTNGSYVSFRVPFSHCHPLKFSYFFPKRLKYHQYLIYVFLFLEKLVVPIFLPF